MLWAHRILFPIKEGSKKVAPVYQIVADRIGRTNTACRTKLHHIKHNVDMGAISLVDALAAKRLPLAAPEKVREQAVGKKSVSRKRAASRKKVLPALASQARKQVAAEKRACSSKDAVADKPLPDRTFKPQKQASAENTALSPKDAVPEKPLSSQACESQKHAPAEKRAVSPEDTPAKKPRPAQASKVRKQATAGKKAVSPKRASARKPPSRPAFTPRPLSIEEEISQFRLGEGGRVDLPPAEPSVEPYTKEELEVAATLQSMKTQEQVPDHSTSPRHDSFAAGSTFGRLQMPDRSISSTERLLEYYVGDRA
jgi:hypothetical protein